MIKPKFSLIFCSVLFVSLLSCTNSVNNSGELPRELTVVEKKLTKANQSFSIDIFKEVVASESEGNVFLSPLSVSMALGMTMNGAKGQTFEEMREILGFNELEIPEINEGYESLISLLTSVDPKVQMEIANSVWNKEGFTVEEAFKQNLIDYFDAEAQELDFEDPAAKDVINKWVSDKTHKKIETIIDVIPADAVMYLINAVYFKGSWVYEFDPEATQERDFKTGDGEILKVDMMNQKNRFPYYVSDKVQLIDLPYGDSMFSMTLLIPGNNETEINDFIESEISLENLTSWYEQLSTGEVGVILPKLELEYKTKLNDVLITMGMPTAFTGAADLSGINGSGELYISKVLHKTYLKMDEEGTEASGVTAVEVGTTSVGPQNINIIFDRPYVMILREQSSGVILFIGKIENPKSD